MSPCFSSCQVVPRRDQLPSRIGNTGKCSFRKLSIGALNRIAETGVKNCKGRRQDSELNFSVVKSLSSFSDDIFDSVQLPPSIDGDALIHRSDLLITLSR